jgi:hypothetical protein
MRGKRRRQHASAYCTCAPLTRGPVSVSKARFFGQRDGDQGLGQLTWRGLLLFLSFPDLASGLRSS